MKRIQDKVKDIVEVRPFRSIRDFTADPAETLSNYHFTDATADLMAKWLDGISAVQPGRGVAYALAGYRGVGKSHFLATLGALASSPDLRGRVSEAHVEFSAQRLQRRHYPVSYLKRGTHATLLEEFKEAIRSTFQIGELSAGVTFAEVLRAACTKSGDTPWILLIDTALERGQRVTRDDGAHLSEIAEAARTENVFVGVALDDDIAGADGSNAAIVRSYSIDYLDQAHLYKVVNAHVFPKDSQKQTILHDIYGYFREVLPSFRWSEQKFSALYPLHPAILEVAPYVRLYVHDFALLGFASEAGERILGRPANSLIALDEVYDNAESGLRKIDDLQEAFAAYDAINSTVVSKIPVMQRLQAKLILKALLLLSLDGQGGTASEICASELIFDESDPEKGVATVDDLLRTFAEAMPNEFRVVAEEGQESRYGFKVSSKENLNNALTEAVLQVSTDGIPGILRRVFSERFPEATPGADGAPVDANVIESDLIWRGAIRHGRILWPGAIAPADKSQAAWTDWEVRIDLDGTAGVDQNDLDLARVVWKPDALRADEIDKLRSYHVLSTSVELREKYSEQIRASIHAHSIAAEKILTRCFLEDGKVVIDGFDYNFTEEARSAQTLSEMFSTMLEPMFETRYPVHPYFTRTLEHDDVASIVTDLYNGTRRDLVDVQSRAQTFAFPLGLVRLEGTSFVPETRERLEQLPISKVVLDLVDAGAGKPVDLADIYLNLRRSPHGLIREAQQMLLTALVAERYVEFVTTSGNRINRRSLDLKIIWDDIVGIARPVETSTSAENLNRWAKLFAKEHDFKTLDGPADREALTAAFAQWSVEWENARLLERFQELPEDGLNVRIWKLTAKASRTFGAIAEKVKAAAEGTVTLEECLDRISEAFAGSETDFLAGEADLHTLASFVKGSVLREEVKNYLAACEATDVPEVERLRERVRSLVAAAFKEPAENLNRELGYAWDKFRREFAEHFDGRHAEVMNAPQRSIEFSDTMKSGLWAEFDILAKLPGFERRYAVDAAEYVRRLTELECKSNTRPLLDKQPFCNCDFSLNGFADLDLLPSALNDAIKGGLASFRRMLVSNGDDVTASIERFAEGSKDPEVEAASRELVSAISSGKDVPRFSDLQLKILGFVMKKTEGPASSANARDASSGQPATRVEAGDQVLLNV